MVMLVTILLLYLNWISNNVLFISDIWFMILLFRESCVAPFFVNSFVLFVFISYRAIKGERGESGALNR
jgi:hypothetical protein